MFVNVIGVYILFGGVSGLEQLILSIYSTLATFILEPIPLFILMGEVMFHSGIAPRMMDALDKWVGCVPGRLSLMAVAGGTLLATLTGASVSSAATLGTVLVPEMEKRGYKKPMTLGPIMGSGSLATMIPPSGLGVLLCSIGRVSIGQTLMAIIVPGLLMAALYAAYIIMRCWLQPSIAPAYPGTGIPITEKITSTVRYILPIGFVIFMVTGVILLGLATPTEAAATGALGCYILTAIYRRLNWELVKKSIGGTVQVTVMMFMVIMGATAFAQILVFSKASQGLLEFTLGLPVSPSLIIIAMMIVALIMGCFMDTVAIMMITIPIFVPVVNSLGFSPVWFGVMYLINIEIGMISPPFGYILFVMKGVAPSDTTMGDIYWAGLPFLVCELIAMGLVFAFPPIALWLPSVMR